MFVIMSLIDFLDIHSPNALETGPNGVFYDFHRPFQSLIALETGSYSVFHYFHGT